MGVDRKWSALSDEREQLTTERDELRREVARLLAERQGMEAIEKYGLSFDEQEAAANDALRFVLTTINEEWRLRANQFELIAAMHVIQSFIIQHMLARLAPQQWGQWWGEPDEGKEP